MFVVKFIEEKDRCSTNNKNDKHFYVHNRIVVFFHAHTTHTMHNTPAHHAPPTPAHHAPPTPAHHAPPTPAHQRIEHIQENNQQNQKQKINQKNMPVIPEVKSIVSELVNRIVLSETFAYDFHPDFEPLTAPLGYQENQRKRVREANEVFNSLKHQRTSSMETLYDMDENEEDMLESLEDYNNMPEGVFCEKLPETNEKHFIFENHFTSGSPTGIDAHPLSAYMSAEEISSWKQKDIPDYLPFKMWEKQSPEHHLVVDTISIFNDGTASFGQSSII